MKVLHPDSQQFSTLIQLSAIITPVQWDIAENEIVLITAPEEYPKYPFQVVVASRFDQWIPLEKLGTQPTRWMFRPKSWWILRDPFGMGQFTVSGRRYHGGATLVEVHEADEVAIRKHGFEWSGPLHHPGPSKDVLAEVLHEETRRVFHHLWGKAHDWPDYDKQEWTRLLGLLSRQGVDL
jgi:hypothetical protein